MPVQESTYHKVLQLAESGYTSKQIAERTGVKFHTVNNIRSGKVQPPTKKRADAGSSKYEGRDSFIEMVKREYMSQGKRSQNLSACVDNVRTKLAMQNLSTPFAKAPKATILNHVYKAADKDNWDLLWISRKHKAVSQSKYAKLWHDYWLQVGFMDYVTIDGRKADQWVAKWTNQALEVIMPQTFAVMELRTREFLHMSISDKAFDAKEVLAILLQTFLHEGGYGRPHLGILTDNGQEQLGKDNWYAMEMFWPREQLQQYKTGQGIPGFHDFFPGHDSPVVPSIPRIPTERAKAPMEAQFYIIQKRMDAFTGGDAYQGGGRHDIVHRTQNRSVDKRYVREHNQVMRYVNALNWFITSDEPTQDGLIPYRLLERPYALKSFAAETGLRPTVEQAVAYCLQTHEPSEIPEENYPQILWASGDRLEKTLHEIGALTFQYQRETVQLWSDTLTEDLIGQTITVVFVPGMRHRAGLFLGRQWLGLASDIPRMYHTGMITVGDGQKAAKEVRDGAMKRIREKNKAVKEYRHELPDMTPPGEVQVFQDYTEERPQLNDETLSNVGPDMLAALEDAGLI